MMNMHGFRLIALVLACVLTLTLAAPAKAEAMEIFTVLAIVSAGIAVLIIVLYLVVANIHGEKRAETPTMVACAETDGATRTCWPVSSVKEVTDRLPNARVIVGPAPALVEQAP